MSKQTGPDGVINARYDLQYSNDANDLIRHHRSVVDYYQPYNNNRELNHNFVRGLQYTPKELAKGKDKRKDLIVFNNIKTSERTIIGLWLQNKYDVEYKATTPADDDLSEVLQQLDAWTSDQQGDDMLDMELVKEAWAGGNAFQECYMDVQEGRKPEMYTSQQNAFAIYWDTESRVLITRTDAAYVDRDSWVSYTELKKRYPDKKNLFEDSEPNGDSVFESTVIHADRSHEEKIRKNGDYLVTERFYKVPGKLYYAEIDGMRIEVDNEDVKQFKKEMPGVQLQYDEVDELYLAIVCKEISNNEFLYNGPYHCQPRDPRTKEIIWPIMEMVAESLAGEPQGFVDHERDPSRVVNQMITNILSSATHAAAASMLIDPTAFVGEPEAKLFARHHADSDRSFQVKKGRVGDAVKPVEKSTVNQDHQYALDYSMAFLREITSAPPSLQGQEEKAGVSGKLNAQRIEQGFNQLQPFMKNYRLFLKQRAKLRYYYWRTYMTSEETFRIIDLTEPDMDPFQTINKMVPEMDAAGRYTGAIKKLNDINSAIYEIHIKESIKSPMYRDRQLAFLERMAGSMYGKSDPGLAAVLLEETIRLSDAPEKTRETLKKYSSFIRNAEMQKRQSEGQMGQQQQVGQELDNEAKMQNIAQTEEEQTGILPGQQTQPRRVAVA